LGLGLAQAPPFPHVCILCSQDVSEDVSSEGEDDDEVDVDDEEDDDDDDEDDDDEATPQEAKYVWKATGTSCDAPCPPHPPLLPSLPHVCIPCKPRGALPC
jgi:hypothetical protein